MRSVGTEFPQVAPASSVREPHDFQRGEHVAQQDVDHAQPLLAGVELLAFGFSSERKSSRRASSQSAARSSQLQSFAAPYQPAPGRGLLRPVRFATSR